MPLRCIVEPGLELAKDKLNALLSVELRAYNRPFRCWSCGGWYVVGHGRKPVTRNHATGITGRPRITCDDKVCIRKRLHWLAGREVHEEAMIRLDGERFRQTMMARAVLRAVEAHWLNALEIAQELGCSVGFVQNVRYHAEQKRRRNGSGVQHVAGSNAANRKFPHVNGQSLELERIGEEPEVRAREARADAIGPALQPARPRRVRKKG